jgi:hypothetical protein
MTSPVDPLMLISARSSASLLVAAVEQRSNAAYCSPLLPATACQFLAHIRPRVESTHAGFELRGVGVTVRRDVERTVAAFRVNLALIGVTPSSSGTR